ncbi:MAG: hypothetical protein ACXWBS_10120, partial [Chthoniobacterales bacterium]
MLSRIALLLALSTSVAFAYSEENLSEQFDVKPGGNLVVDVAFGSIYVASAANDKVSIEAHRKIETSDQAKEKQYLAEVPIVITNENNTVTVRARRTEKDSWSWNCTDNMNMDARYTVHVPKNFNLNEALRHIDGYVQSLRAELSAAQAKSRNRDDRRPEKSGP